MRIGFVSLPSLACIGLAATAQRAKAEEDGPSEPYVYAIYYGSEDCTDIPGTVRGYASDQTFQIQGYSAESRKNETDMDLCTLETVCINRPTATACTAENELIRLDHVGTLSVSEEGLIFECDTTNVDAECSFLDPECYGSSIYPHCHFQIVTTSTLVADPSIIKHSNAANEGALDLTSYMVFYSDEECKNVEGLEMVVNNETNLMGMTNEDISCRDAMMCVLHPESDELGKVCQEVLGVDTPPTFDLKMMPISEDGHAVPCDAEGYCEPISADTCQKSTLHPNCYFRLPTSAAFYGAPETFLTNYVSDDAGDATEDTGAGAAAEVESEPAGEPSSGGLVPFSAIAALMWSALVVVGYGF